MAYHIPRKLAVSMGVELTFIPTIYERVFNETGVALWAGYNYVDSIRGPLAEAAERVLEKNNVKVYACGTDPDCVEISTLPYTSGNKIKKNMHAIRKCAAIVDLSPTAPHTIGGGAHIHTGFPEGVNVGLYKAHMMHFYNQNPWLSYAFSGWNDVVNARPAWAESFAIEASKSGTPMNVRLGHKVMSTHLDMKDYLECALKYEKALHIASVWQNESYSESREDNEKYRAMYMRYYHEAKRNFNKACDELLAYMEDNLTVEKVPQGRISVYSVGVVRGKGYGVTLRNETIEFRCFLMSDHISGHVKHLALVDAICRRAINNAKAGNIYVAPLLTKKDNDERKYSVLKARFHDMLRELGFNPKDFRSETVNMARKLRFMRGQIVRA